MPTNPYDQLAYRCAPIEWSAPERLAVASLLHGGPRPRRDRYRVLELGCGNAANLIPLAYYRPHSEFVGVDGAHTQTALAQSRCTELRLQNIRIHHADFLAADAQLEGRFDYILVHGVLSWVDEATREALLAICSRRLAPGGLVYLNYNCRPGWNIRGMVRELLMAQTADGGSLQQRALAAQEVSARMAEAYARHESPYCQLLSNEFRVVCDHDAAYIAHEYLAEHNVAFWRSEFMALAALHGLVHVADADFNYESGRVPPGLPEQLAASGIHGRCPEDTLDLLVHRQLHSPILAHTPLVRRLPEPAELCDLVAASPLVRQRGGKGKPVFVHPSTAEVEAREPSMCKVLDQMQKAWPRGERLGDLVPSSPALLQDLLLLHRNGLIDLRRAASEETDVDPQRLNAFEARFDDFQTSPYHFREQATRALVPA